MRSWLILDGKAPPVSGVSGQDAMSVRSQAPASGLFARLLMPSTKAPRERASSAILTASTVEPELDTMMCTASFPAVPADIAAICASPIARAILPTRDIL